MAKTERIELAHLISLCGVEAGYYADSTQKEVRPTVIAADRHDGRLCIPIVEEPGGYVDTDNSVSVVDTLRRIGALTGGYCSIYLEMDVADDLEVAE